MQRKSPRIGKVEVQQCYCIYFQRPGNCNCATGPFSGVDHKWPKDWYEEWLEDCVGVPLTVSYHVSSFIDHLMSGSLVMGDRDICDMNGDVNHSVVDDTQTHKFGQLM